MTDKKVSIVTPYFDRWPIIKETYQSLINQTYTHWEWILVNDNSSPNHWKPLLDLVAGDKRVKTYNRTEFSSVKGANSARNVGIKKATGFYVIFLDSDDVISDTCLDNRVKLSQLEKCNIVHVFQGVIFYNKFNDDGRLLSTNLNASNCVKAFYNRDVAWVNFSPFWQRDTLLNYNLFWDEKCSIYEDVLFHIKALSLGIQFKVHESILDSFWRWGNYEKKGDNELSPKNIEAQIYYLNSLKKMSFSFIRIQNVLDKIIKRHVYELILNPYRKKDYQNSLLSFNLLKINKSLNFFEVFIFNVLMKSKNLTFPLNRIMYKIIYSFLLKKKHSYNRKYFGVRYQNA